MSGNQFKRIMVAWTVFLLINMQNLFAQQLPLYSEYMFNTFEINPAYAGFRNAVQITSMFRKQWTGFKSAPQSTFISADMPVASQRVGLGLELMNDRDEITRTLGAQAAYSYKIPVGDYSTLAFGLQAGAINFKYDFTKVDVIDPNDPSFSQNINTLQANFGTGVFFSSENFYVGVSTPNLVRTSLRKITSDLASNEVKQNMHMYFNTGYVFVLNDDLRLKPSVLVRGVVGSPLSYDVNTNLWIADIISVGASYRNKNAIVGVVDLQVVPGLRLGYAYDHTISSLNLIAKGSHEVILRYEISYDRMGLSPRYF